MPIPAGKTQFFADTGKKQDNFFCFFGLHFYISSRKMSRKTNCSEIIRKNRHKLRIIKRRLYKESGGCCQECGKKFEMGGLQIHHIVPTSENQRLAVSTSNIQLVCPECHSRLHGRPVGGKIEENEQ